MVSNRREGVRELETGLRKYGIAPALVSSVEGAANLLKMRAFAILILDLHFAEVLESVSILLSSRANAPALVLTGNRLDPVVSNRPELSFATFIPFANLAQQLPGLVTAFRDIHAEKGRASEHIIETLKAREADLHRRYQLLADEDSEYALISTDSSGRINEWSASARKLFGYEESEAIGQHLSLIFTEEDQRREIPQRELNESAANGTALDNRYLKKKDGSIFYAIGRLVAIQSTSSTPGGFTKVIRDASIIKKLQEHEANFSEIFHNANEGIWILDEHAHVQLVNNKMAEMLGYAVEDILGRYKLDFAFPEDAEYIKSLFYERSTGKSASVDVRFRHRDGHAVWTHMSARPIFRDGKFAGALDLFSDVTPRREAEEKLRAFFENSATGNAILDPQNGRFIEVNERFCVIAARTRDELLRLTFRDITHPDDRPIDEQRFAQLRSGATRETLAEKRYVRPDNSVVWVNLATTMVFDSNGARRFQVSVVQDITARKIAEVQLLESQQQLKLATEAARLGIFYVNLTKGEITWNDQLRLLLGLPLDTPPSMETYFSHVDPNDAKRMREVIARVVANPNTSQNFDDEHRILLPDGSVRYVATHASQTLQTDTEGNRSVVIVGTLRDITTERAFEAELRKQVSEKTGELVERTNQLQALLYTVAHDLRAPLRAMHAYAGILQEEGAEVSPESGGYLQKIQDAARRMDQLTTDLLDYSRLSQMHVELEPVSIADAIDTAQHDLEHELKRRHVNLDVAPQFPTVRASRFLLERCLTNLLSNAIRFCPNNRVPQISIWAENRDQRVRVLIKDNGIGIPEKHYKRIFGVFEKAHSTRDFPGGTGIGLAIVAAALKRMNGIYGVESELQVGTTFWIELDAL